MTSSNPLHPNPNWVAEITESFPASTWRYVPTSHNPADLLTRGISAHQLKTSDLWFHGPSWLTTTEQWPTWSPTNVLDFQNVDTEVNIFTEEKAKHNSCNNLVYTL